MRLTHYLILFAIFGSIAIILTMLFEFFIWACGVAFIVFMLGFVMSIEIYLKERKEQKAKPVYIDQGDASEYVQTRLQVEPSGATDGVEFKFELRKIRINSYVKYFEINEPRAAALYDAGFDNLSKLSKAKISRLVAVPGINPTLAKRIKLQLGSDVE